MCHFVRVQSSVCACGGGGMGCIGGVYLDLCVSCALEEDMPPPSHTWVVRFIDVHDWVLFS